MIINKMIKIIRMLFESYLYVSNIINYNILSNDIDIFYYIINEGINESNDHSKETKDNKESKDNKEIEMYNNNYKIYMSSNNNYKKENNKLIKRSETMVIKFKECSWCNNNIDSTNQITYHYMDNIYCNIKCRNKQIESDTLNTIKNNQQIRYNYSI